MCYMLLVRTSKGAPRAVHSVDWLYGNASAHTAHVMETKGVLRVRGLYLNHTPGRGCATTAAVGVDKIVNQRYR